jgi:hypothetical protein
MCFVFIWEQTAPCATYSINWLDFITEMKTVYSAVRTWSLNKDSLRFVFKWLKYTWSCEVLSSKRNCYFCNSINGRSACVSLVLSKSTWKFKWRRKYPDDRYPKRKICLYVSSFTQMSGLHHCKRCSILILLASCQQTCMTYTIAVCTV